MNPAIPASNVPKLPELRVIPGEGIDADYEGSAPDLSLVEAIPEPADVTPFQKVVTSPYRKLKNYPTKTTAGAIMKGAALGIPETLADYGQTIAQTWVDGKQIIQLERHHEEEADAEDTKRKFTKTRLAGWYAMFGAYQVADDAITYPLFLMAQHNHDTLTAYGVAGAAGLILAAGMGMGQREVEETKAELREVETVTAEVPDHGRRVLDASVNSAPWQVALIANRSREEGEAVPLVGRAKIAQYAGAYALANTGLYTVADSLPMGEWTGFGVALATVWTLGGVYSAVKEQGTFKPMTEKFSKVGAAIKAYIDQRRSTV